MPSPHDALFRFTFADPVHTAPLLRALLPPDLGAAIDWDSLAPADGCLVDDQQQGEQCDRLFTVRFLGERARPRAARGHGGAFVAIQLEHKSRPDKWTVLPVVVHFGRGRWRASTDLKSLVDFTAVPAPLRSAVAACLPQFSFAVHDFAARSAAEVRAMALSLQGLCTVSLLQFLAPVGADDARVQAVIADWKDVARAIADAPTGQDAWQAVTSYILKVTKLGRRQLRRVIDREIGAPAMKKFVSTYDQILQEGEARGVARGKAAGKAEGRAEQLLRQLDKRFGKVSAAAQRRVRGASIEDLDRWALRLLDADSLSSVFADS